MVQSGAARVLLAEFFGTFCLVLAGTGAIIVNDTSGAVTHVGIALVFGLVVMVMIDTIGPISGAHMNPAVSVGFALAGRFPWARVGPYAIAQCMGAFAASALWRWLSPEHPTLGATLPSGDEARSFVFEVVLTCILMVAVLSVSSGWREKGLTASVTIGGLIALEALFAGPISGASMNPARSLAPAVVSGRTESLWLYLAAPTLGAAAGVLVWNLLCGDREKVARATSD
ncbi:MAG: aquaporin [Planctomycetota bacterium]|nr:aquaporin [Planctomycetota bacterium]